MTASLTYASLVQLVPESKTHPAKSRLIEDVTTMMSQWNDIDQQRPCEICIDNCASGGRDSLNHESEDEENTLPPPKLYCNIDRSSRHAALTIISLDLHQGSCQDQYQEYGIAPGHHQLSNKNRRATYNRRLGNAGLDCEPRLRLGVEDAPIDRCADIDVLLDGL